MLNFQPPGFEQRVTETHLGIMTYYTQTVPVDNPAPTLVFLHSLGGGSSAYEWSKVYGALAADYAIIAPDLVGWGQSAHPAHSYQVEDYFKIITHLLETVLARSATGIGVAAPTGLDQPSRAIVIASSLTAGVVIRLAIQRPDLFQQLLLVSPAGNDDFGRGYRYTLPALLAGTPGLDQVVYGLGAANELAVTQFLATFLFAKADRITPETVAAYLASTLQPNAQYSALASLRGDICFDLARYMAQLTVPTRIILGAESRLNPARQGERLAALSTAVQSVQVLPDLGVLPHVEYPAVVVGLLRGYLADRLSHTAQ
ncbi:alpha/beta fold hydrolase [Leptolyngbya sp. PCC 6406]|uniref:alpha/beta fold hydrolase n=1 Tax=Leptolyngbya sp. PCC 6406 TaxID=1173264 RepID=UPI0002ABA23C|nr:alpha/beta hydrolase [Leptolyngbya sp. PCC 6406]